MKRKINYAGQGRWTRPTGIGVERVNEDTNAMRGGTG